MKNYIIFDLEWNQSPRGREDSVADFPFEIIEIGAVKLDENFQMVDEFHRLFGLRSMARCSYDIRSDSYEYGGAEGPGDGFSRGSQTVSLLVR